MQDSFQAKGSLEVGGQTYKIARLRALEESASLTVVPLPAGAA